MKVHCRSGLSRVRDAIQLLVVAVVVHAGYWVARLIGLPGAMYYRYGRALGWALLWRKDPRAFRMLMCPVSITRYFEFDFVLRALGAGDQPMACLDVSSPFLFSFHAIDHHAQLQVDMINPDAADLEHTRSLLPFVRGRDRIHLAVKGVQDLPPEPVYDAIWSISVVEHIAGDKGDDRDAVRVMWNLLRPGGLLILTVPTDAQAWDEFRKTDPYGTQPGSDGRYFFQRFYDEQSVNDRIIASVGQPPKQITWFGEKEKGHFHAYIQRWLKEGTSITFDDPLEIAMHYRYYDTHREMPGAGVCGLMFRKP